MKNIFLKNRIKERQGLGAAINQSSGGCVSVARVLKNRVKERQWLGAAIINESSGSAG